MGGLSVEVHFKVGAGNELLLEYGAAFGMGGNHGVHIVEEPRIGHGHLAAGVLHIAFFGRGAEHMHAPGGEMAGKSYGRTAGGHAEEVVPAGVPEAGQSVEFRKKGDFRPGFRTGHGMERRGHVEQIALDAEAVCFQKICQAGGRFEFLIAEFRFVEDGGGYVLHLRGNVFDLIEQKTLLWREFRHGASFERRRYGKF